VARRQSWQYKLLILIALALVIVLTHSIWMGWLGDSLVDSERPSHADFIVVLGGDPYGHRILKAAELVKEGFAERVLVSGPSGFYGLHEDELAIPFAVRHGYPAVWFNAFQHNAHSTEEEAIALLPDLQKSGAHQVIVVTSDYHSRRALRTLRSHWPGIQIWMVTAPDEYFSAHGWWHTREGRKIFLLEWTKTIASLVGM